MNEYILFAYTQITASHHNMITAMKQEYIQKRAVTKLTNNLKQVTSRS